MIQINIRFGSIHLTLNQGSCWKTVKRINYKSQKYEIELLQPSKQEKIKGKNVWCVIKFSYMCFFKMFIYVHVIECLYMHWKWIQAKEIPLNPGLKTNWSLVDTFKSFLQKLQIKPQVKKGMSRVIYLITFKNNTEILLIWKLY